MLQVFFEQKIRVTACFAGVAGVFYNILARAVKKKSKAKKAEIRVGEVSNWKILPATPAEFD
ncbi:MAG: hypothetical protein IJK81_03510 [Selenomonadaceae bacterium]|nr:hypothetical protein [Selenomonadaceae bacterium]